MRINDLEGVKVHNLGLVGDWNIGEHVNNRLWNDLIDEVCWRSDADRHDWIVRDAVGSELWDYFLNKYEHTWVSEWRMTDKDLETVASFINKTRSRDDNFAHIDFEEDISIEELLGISE